MPTKAIVIAALLTLASCAQTGHRTEPATLGAPITWQEVEASLDQAGPIEFERIVTADWEVPRSGLINLKADAAADLEDGPEPIQIYMYAIRHPDHGLFLVDTGVDRATASHDKKEMAASWIVRGGMNLEALDVHVDTATWVASHGPLAGVFLTHLHLDHAMGVPDIPDDVPLYTGPGESKDSKFMNMFTRGTTNRMLRGKGAIQELQPRQLADAPFDAALDVFGDGSLIAIHVPGHTAGSLAFLARTTEGTVLMTGDGCHTAWGWDHDVESGTYNTDTDKARESFKKLRQFAQQHPQIAVHLGHQPHDRNHAPTVVSHK